MLNLFNPFVEFYFFIVLDRSHLCLDIVVACFIWFAPRLVYLVLTSVQARPAFFFFLWGGRGVKNALSLTLCKLKIATCKAMHPYDPQWRDPSSYWSIEHNSWKAKACNISSCHQVYMYAGWVKPSNSYLLLNPWHVRLIYQDGFWQS